MRKIQLKLCMETALKLRQIRKKKQALTTKRRGNCAVDAKAFSELSHDFCSLAYNRKEHKHIDMHLVNGVGLGL